MSEGGQWRIYWRSILVDIKGRFQPLKEGQILVVGLSRAEIIRAFNSAIEDLFGEKANVLGIDIIGLDHIYMNQESLFGRGLTEVIIKAIEEYYEKEVVVS